ncbi:MAG: YggS family pyridoxal phosphate-dependent enzyme [Streptosporangiales bacterium]|nr:YggS family pyridoxal phosphate-dependent enzyme [Streptosporangiales bacterium]
MAVDRRAEIAANLEAVERRIAAACAAAGRRSEEITLVAVTKTFPASDVRLLASLGVTHIGENRDQEAAPKAAAASDLDLTWHFVGQLQTNKCRSVASYAHVVHSIDRPRLVGALGREARRAGRVIRCLVQVCFDAEPGRGGAAPSAVPALADEVAAEEGLELGGVMTVAPLDENPDPAFAALADLAAEVRAAHPRATTISAGMTGDLESAMAHGATLVRLGTALLGTREAIVR